MNKDELTSAAAADRAAGLTYKAISAKYGFSVPMLRYHLRRAVRTGAVTPESIRYEPTGRTAPVLPDGEYDAAWVKRVVENVEFSPTGCWLWKGMQGDWGYGQTTYRNKTRIVHRQFYQVVNGVKLDRWQLVMHKCDTPNCINPAHLVVGSPGENVKDAANKGHHHNTRKVICKRGHPLSGDNVRTNSFGTRVCMTCTRARMRIKAGWGKDEAYAVPAIPPNQTNKRRIYGKKAA